MRRCCGRRRRGRGFGCYRRRCCRWRRYRCACYRWSCYRRCCLRRRGGVRFRGETFGTQAQSDQRKRTDFTVGHQVLVGLETLEGVHRVGPPLARGLALQVAFARKSLLNFLVPFARRGLLIVARWAADRFAFATRGGACGPGRGRLRASFCRPASGSGSGAMTALGRFRWSCGCA